MRCARATGVNRLYSLLLLLRLERGRLSLTGPYLAELDIDRLPEKLFTLPLFIPDLIRRISSNSSVVR